jgi:hypothetical protein
VRLHPAAHRIRRVTVTLIDSALSAHALSALSISVTHRLSLFENVSWTQHVLEPCTNEAYTNIQFTTLIDFGVYSRVSVIYSSCLSVLEQDD